MQHSSGLLANSKALDESSPLSTRLWSLSSKCSQRSQLSSQNLQKLSLLDILIPLFKFGESTFFLSGGWGLKNFIFLFFILFISFFFFSKKCWPSPEFNLNNSCPRSATLRWLTKVRPSPHY